MKIIRKGNRKGLDIDYQVNVETPEEVEELHKKLLKQGFLFLYGTGDKPYEAITSNRVLHYIDKELKLYDFAFLFTEQPPKVPKERKSKIDEAYERAVNDATYRRKLMKFMRFHKLLTAFRKHMKAYGELKPAYIKRLNKVIDEIGIPHFDYTDTTLKELDEFLFASLE